ncbi:hypothetical protein [Hymenobacter rubripertinctus]|uniref:Uncharacterized protein n=1 Tax=Hymenobacter rubripertinctus TaxID=2029981 RepID=A0A418QJX0_9BACT|nr:hypothetical protein [Hymenobacter rubripertinctus]RIY05399.1 hypothetical protein D0T11_20475 [Hymenobacter rubripertinctus]
MQPALNVAFQTVLQLLRFGAFVQGTRRLLPSERLAVSAGLRTDGNNDALITPTIGFIVEF